MTVKYNKSINKETSYKDRLQELRTIQGVSFKEKIENTKKLLSHIIREHKRPTIAWSGGKDSTVLLHMALAERPDIDVLWVNTGVEFPECIHFITDIKKRWELNLHIARPNTTFWKAVEEFGWPMLGKGGSGGWKSRADYLERKGKIRLAKITREVKIAAACCRVLKENPAKRMYKELQTDCVILGNMVAESRQRFLIWAQRGEYYYATSESRYKAWPMAAWDDDNVWEYHRCFRLPYSKIYDKGHRRNGCWPCLMDIRFPDNKLRALRLSHPKLWNFIMVKKGLGKRLLTLKLALHEEEEANLGRRIEVFIKERPCYFDRL